MMYTYDIKPLNRSLEPASSVDDDIRVIHIGSVIKGKVLGKDKHVIGQVQRSVEDHDNNIKYYVVMDPETSTMVKVDPTSAFVWEPEDETPLGSEISPDDQQYDDEGVE